MEAAKNKIEGSFSSFSTEAMKELILLQFSLRNWFLIMFIVSHFFSIVVFQNKIIDCFTFQYFGNLLDKQLIVNKITQK
jgi:hypothetical protein